jgi:protein-disulfide isomerase
MRVVTKLLVLAGAAAAMGACQKQSAENIAIDNVAANADIETLPADESSTTPSDQLANGQDGVDVNDLNASSNAF